MKKILCILSVALILVSCGKNHVSTIVGNPVVDQINIGGGENFKYEVYFKTNGEDASRLLTNFRYQVGDTLISYYEFFDVKLTALKDSLAATQKQLLECRQENEKLKINVNLLLANQKKID